MEEQEKMITSPEDEAQKPQETPNKTAFYDRYKKDYPEDNADDEESVYGRMNERNKEYDKLKGDNENFRKLVNDNPQYGGMFVDMMDGKNFIESFLGRFPKEDILAAYDDPDMAKKLADSQADYLKKQEDSRKLQEEGDTNVQESIRSLSDYCDKNGIDQDGANRIWGACLDFAGNALKGKFGPELFDLVNKGQSYTDDVSSARREGEIAGHNAKVQTQLAKGKGPEGIPPTFDGGQGSAAPEKAPKQQKKFYNPFSHEYEEG